MENAVDVYNAEGSHPVVLVCEHASADMPARYAKLGLADGLERSHIAWDPGALDTAKHLSKKLNAVLVAGTVSRLIYDLNRPPDAASAMVVRSECYTVPGNRNLDAAEKQSRIDSYYQPFVDELARVLSTHNTAPVLVTVHSFTPVYNGEKRPVEIGVLHDTDTRLADAMLANSDGFNIQRNEPYGPDDGVTHTLKVHGIANRLLNVMIEIRNDLIADSEACESMAEYLTGWIEKSLPQVYLGDISGLQSCS